MSRCIHTLCSATRLDNADSELQQVKTLTCLQKQARATANFVMSFRRKVDNDGHKNGLNGSRHPDTDSNGVPRNFIRGGRGSTNSVEGRGHRERGSRGDSPLVRGSEAAVIWYKKFHFI